MIRGIYTAVSGLITQESKMDVITNNLANADTVAFKTDNLHIKKFKDVLIEKYDRTNGVNEHQSTIGALSLGSRIDETTTSFSQGVFQETENKTDFAIDGRGFFLVQRNQGNNAQNYYTRDGHFHVNSGGYLVNSSGDYVLDTKGNSINVGDSDFSTDDKGNLSIDGANANIKVAMVDFNPNEPVNTAYANLVKEGDNLYKTTDVAIESNASLKQKSLEKSNVNVISQMVDMITVMRTFESNQKILQSMDESLGKAVNEVGSSR